MSHSIILRIRNVSDKSCRGNQNTLFCAQQRFFENCAVYEIKWKNIIQQGTPQMIIWRMCIACWIAKATHTFSAYIILNAFPLQQWLQ
jgi:NAD-dependent dihydropyrimidine dehydrogenase PreA subunit